MINSMLRVAAIAACALVTVPALAQEHGTADEAVALVKKAVAHFKASGQEKACAAFADPSGGFQAKDLYVFVQNLDGTMICHAKNPGLNAKNLKDLKDSDGTMFVDAMMKTASGKGSGWVDYKWVNAQSKKIEPKSTYVEKTGDLFIGAGIYKP